MISNRRRRAYLSILILGILPAISVGVAAATTSFLRSSPAGLVPVPAAHAAGQHASSPEYDGWYSDFSDEDVVIVETGDWVFSFVSIPAAPAGATVTAVDVSYDIIHPEVGDLTVYLGNQAMGAVTLLWHDPENYDSIFTSQLLTSTTSMGWRRTPICPGGSP